MEKHRDYCGEGMPSTMKSQKNRQNKAIDSKALQYLL